MRIATYNIWNSSRQWPQRLAAIQEEMNRIDADVVALQEVPVRVTEGDLRDAATYLQESTQYSHAAVRKYPGHEQEALAFLSKYPFGSIEAGWETSFAALGNCGVRVEIDIDGTLYAVTNVHLDYRSIATREAQIIAIVEWITATSKPQCLELLCGDFNCYPDSSIHRFLLGQQTLHGKDTVAWHDLAACYAAVSNTPALPTLDFHNNPRWEDEATLAIPARVDWILLQERYPLPSPSLKRVELFGTVPTPATKLVPSDHYGVLAEITISE